MNDIIVSGLSRSFDGKTVLRDLNLRFQAGVVTCIMGPSGCGKTTLLNILAGLVQPDCGSITGLPDKKAFVFQEDRLCEDFSAIQNIRLVTGKTLSQNEILSHLEGLGLADSAFLPVKKLSGGMKRRVAIARAVCFGAELLLLDEAFKGLDAERCRLTIEYILSRCRGKTVLCVTHDPAEAAYLGGRIVTLDGGARALQEDGE